MKKLSAVAMSLLVTAVAEAAAIEQVIVRQQWPWSTDVKVEYRLSGVDAQHPVNLGVKAYNGDVELDASRLEESITGDRYGLCESGVGQFIIDPVTAFGTEKVALANFKVKLTLSESDANASEVIYKIFDLDPENLNPNGTFKCTDVTRADIKNKHYGDFETDFNQLFAGANSTVANQLIWTGVTNNPAYKTTKLVMRKIPAGTFSMGQTGGNFSGSTNAEQVHDVTLTKDFYICVYPVTQEQYRKLTRGTWNGSGHKGDAFPVESATYEVFQSVITNDTSTGLNHIAANLGVPINYPTEAQWEYACRAGTTSELYTGQPLNTANLSPIAWHSGNSGNNTCEVGLKLPNAFGLYDMLGNVYEACRDTYKDSSVAIGYKDGAAVTDPEEEGPASGGLYVMRGGSFNLNNIRATSAGRYGSAGNWTAYGFRLAFTVTD